MNTQQLLRHWNSRRSLSSRDKVIRLIWSVLHEQAEIFIHNIEKGKENVDFDIYIEQEKLVNAFVEHYLQADTPTETLEELIAPFDSNFSPFEWRLIAMKRFFTGQVLSNHNTDLIQ